MARITFVRHSQARQAREGMKDSERTLTREGKRIAAKRRKTLAGRQFDLAVVSYTARTVETFDAIASVPTCVVTKMLIHSKNQDDEFVLEAAFQKLKYSPLSVYLSESSAVQGALECLADEARDLILGLIEVTGAENVLVVGHDIWMQAIIGSDNEGNFHPLLNENWPFCGGVDVVLEDGEIVSIEPLPSLH